MKRRKSYTAAFKLDAVKYRDVHGTLAAAVNFNVTEGMIRKWVADRENLEQMPATKRARRYKKPSSEEVEDDNYNSVFRQESIQLSKIHGIRTSQSMIHLEHLGIPELAFLVQECLPRSDDYEDWDT